MNPSSGHTVIVPMDHGVTLGPIDGLMNMKNMADEIVKGGANAILGHIGLRLQGKFHGKAGFILHLSAGTIWAPDPNTKVLVSSVEMALKIGADAVSVHVNIGAETEAQMLGDLGKVSRECLEWGMPLLAMMYTRGEKFQEENSVEGVKHAARIAAELGADLVKVSYTGSKESFRKVVAGCPIPVLIAGGEKTKNEREILQVIRDALDAGAAGVSIGRNVFQHEKKRAMVRAISKMVHDGISVEEALEILNSHSLSRPDFDLSPLAKGLAQVAERGKGREASA